MQWEHKAVSQYADGDMQMPHRDLIAAYSQPRQGTVGLVGPQRHRRSGAAPLGGEQGPGGHRCSSSSSPLLCLAQPPSLLGSCCCSIFKVSVLQCKKGGRRALGREEWHDRTTQVLFQVRSEGEKSLFAPGPKTALGVGSNSTAGTSRAAKHS